MMKRRMVLHITACLVAVLAMTAAPARAQVTPPGTDLTNGNGPMTQPQRDQVTQFISHYLRQLATPPSDPKADTLIKEAREHLIRPTNAPGVTAWWLSTYSQMMQSGLTNLLNSREPLHRVNALIVAGELGSDTAVDVLARQVMHRDLPTRLWAASAMSVALRKADRGAITAGSITTATREVSRAAEAEESPIVFRKQLQALYSVQVAATMTNNPTGPVRQARLDTVDTVLKRIAGKDGEPSGHVIAIYETLSQIRLEFLGMPAASQRQIGPMVVKVCQSIFDVIGSHWNAAHNPNADPKVQAIRARYGEILEFCETFIAVADDVVRTPSAQPARPGRGLTQGWRQVNQAGYEQLRTAWRNFVMQTPPYNSLR